ncbi:zinc dependent phospholipase C family protein, partial [Singulisphaera rosea]
DLAHCVRPSQLARNMLGLACNEAGRALAWGWITHVVADVAIHPLINEAAAEQCRGGRLPPMSYVDDPLLHIRVEQGLDAYLPGHADWPDSVVCTPFSPDAQAATLIAAAYRDTYGFTPSPLRLRLANRISPWFFNFQIVNGRVVSGKPVPAAWRWIHGRATGVARRFGQNEAIEAFMNPLCPPDWLLDEAAAAVDTVVTAFPARCSSEFGDYPDYNLDTGRIDSNPPVYPLTLSTLRQLDHRLEVRRWSLCSRR